jgi:hypothetical protein
MPEDLVLPVVLLAVLLVLVAGYRPGGSVNGPGGPSVQVLPVAAVLGVLIAVAVRALRVKPDELRRTVYQVTDRRVLVTTGPGHTWAAFLDQLAEPVVVPRRYGTADLSLRDPEKFRLSLRKNFPLWQRQLPPWALAPDTRQPFPMLRGLSDAEVARQMISAGRARMLRGELDVPPVPALPGSALPGRFVPAPGEQVVWSGRPQTAPWWFGTADIAVCAYYAALLGFFVFVVSWEVSNGALSQGTPLPFRARLLFAGFFAFAVALIGYPAGARVLRRHARIKRSVYILTSWRLITAWGRDSRTAGTQYPLGQLLPPQVKNGSVFMQPAWPSPPTRQDSRALLMWPAASTDPPQLIALPDPQAVADLICSAQLAERARTWQLRNSHIHGNWSSW